MTRPTYRVVALADRHSLIKISDRIAFITRSLKRVGKNGRTARVVNGYFGFVTEREAAAFITGLKKYFPRCYCQIRASQRLTTAFEVKVRDFSALENFIWQFAANMAIVSTAQPQPYTAAAAKADLQQDYPAPIAPSNVVQFVDRSNAPTIPRSRPKVIGGISID